MTIPRRQSVKSAGCLGGVQGLVDNGFAFLYRAGGAPPEKPERKRNLETVDLHFIEPEEIPLLLAAAEGNPRDQAMLAVLAYQGLRSNECVMLDLADVRWDSDELVVRHAKGGKQRLLPLEPVKPYLKAWLDVRPKVASPVLFLSRQGRMSNRHLRNLVKGYGNTAGVGKKMPFGLHPHALRHTVATHMTRFGVDSRVVQVYMGHSSPAVTAMYQHVNLTQKREAVATLMRSLDAIQQPVSEPVAASPTETVA